MSMTYMTMSIAPRPPVGKTLQHGDVPEEEFEIREILTCWYQAGFVPFIEGNPEQISFWDRVDEFKRLTKTLALLIRCRAYQSAVKRITSQWQSESLEFRYIHYLLYKVRHV
ncbi:hypothetical protein JCM19240_906 [Vibrio maritimus]|uniref:Uncharacterized protein n=1 Tax=Vibrio maritimus TaxID=990268 RepID=A0A090T496_9VIBR|nr:hypothetical protein JCM19240_906 [Vibrio maritimus]